MEYPETAMADGSGQPSVSGYNSSRQQQHKSDLDEELNEFWSEMMEDVQNCGTEMSEFKTQQLPLARIKKIMKSDEDVRMISAEAPVLFAKACEFFILEMTLRAWKVAEESKRRTLTRQDVSTAVNRTEVWDFLADTVPVEEGGAPIHSGGETASGSIPGRPLGVTMPGEDVNAVPHQMDPYEGQYMHAPMGGMATPGAPAGMFPPGMRPIPMMYQGMPPGMYMQGPPQMMNPNQPNEQGSGHGNGESQGERRRSQRKQ